MQEQWAMRREALLMLADLADALQVRHADC